MLMSRHSKYTCSMAHMAEYTCFKKILFSIYMVCMTAL